MSGQVSRKRSADMLRRGVRSAGASGRRGPVMTPMSPAADARLLDPNYRPADKGVRRMTEQEWLASEDPAAMLRHLTHWDDGLMAKVGGSATSDRKLRLWCGALFALSTHNYRGKDRDAWERGEPFIGEGSGDLPGVAHQWATGLHDNPGDPPAATRAALLRDIVGNPFRPIRDPWSCRLCGGSVDDNWQDGERRCAECSALQPLIRWLDWNGGAVLALARAAYDERRESGQLDNDRLAVLADALSDAGCSDETILTHLRSDGAHVRGCWVLDLLTGRE
jgi:hypothetical protein